MKTVVVQPVQLVVSKRFPDARLFNVGVGVLGGILISKKNSRLELFFLVLKYIILMCF